jgi:GT2 family glycosyltransferase
MDQLAPQPSRIELVAIINSFNRRELLERAIGSLTQALRKTTFRSAIVVFDAGSTDGSRQFLNTWSEQSPADNLIVVTSSVNGSTSFADGVNTACSTALARFPDCRWLFLYETDNWLGSIKPLSEAISLLEAEPGLASAGFTVRRHSGVPCGYGMRFPSSISLTLGLNLAVRWNLERPNASAWRETGGIRWRTCDVIFTSPLLIRRATWEQSKGFDAGAFPFSDSDLDWAWRCAKLGWKMAVIESKDVVHDNLQQASAWSSNRVIDFHRSRLRLLKRHRGGRVTLIKPLLFFRHLVETIMLMGRGGSDSVAGAKLVKRRQLLNSVWTDYS